MNFLWELEDLEEDEEDDLDLEDDPDEEIERNPRHHVSNPRSCCACDGIVADLSQEELSAALYEWVLVHYRNHDPRCQQSDQIRCA